MHASSLRALICTIGLAMAVAPAYAQQMRGSIEGVVRDASGAVLPGVTVDAKSEAGVVFSTTSDDAGIYRFPAVPTGTYTVSATLAGFGPGTVNNVEVAAGQIKTVNFALAIAGVAETVEVTAMSPLVDVKQSERSTHIRADLIERLPRGRDFSSVVTQAPGANSESRLGGLSVDGASAGENRYIIDGAETTDLVSGTQGKELIVDFIEEVEVRSSGYTAEFGGAMGGVINVITKSGTNEFRGDVGTYFQSDALGVALSAPAGPQYVDGRRSLRRNLTNSNLAEYVTYDEDSYTRWDPGFTLGGPILRDRLWFFTSYQPALERRERTVTFRSNGQTSSYDQEERTHYSTNNIRGQIGNNTTARLAFSASPGSRNNLLPNPDGSSNPASDFGIDRKTPNYTVSGNFDYVASDRLFLGVRGGYFTADIHDENFFEGPRYIFSQSNIGMAGVPAQFQRVTGFSTVLTNTATIKDQQTRANFQADATYYANFGGRHTFKGGVQFDRLGNKVEDGETGNRVQLQWGQTLGGLSGPFGYYQVRSNGVVPKRGFITQGDVSVTNVGLFFQDAWTINERLTLNLGIRTENENVPAFSEDPGVPDTAIEFRFADKLAPRVGFAYDIMGDGRWKAYGSWGLFYDFFKLELPRGSFGGDKWLEYYYTLDTPDWTSLVSASDCPPACPGTLIRGPIDFRHVDFTLIDPDLDPMRMQEAVFGLEHQLRDNLALSMRYVHKQVDKAIEDVGLLDAQQNEIYKIANPGFGTTATFAVAGTDTVLAFPKAVRDYDAVELAMDRRLSGNWGLRVSYTWSRLFGNYSGLSQSDENGRTSPNVGRMFDYPVMMFDQNGDPVLGRLGTDRPHQFKTQFLYETPWGTSLGLNEFISSGVPVTREARLIPPNNFPVQYLGRLSDGRTPVFSQTDLFLQHEFRLPGDQGLAFNVTLLNLFNEENTVHRFPTLTQVSAGIVTDEAAFYNGINVESLQAAQGVPGDPRFLRDAEFQAPRSVRLGFRWSF